MATLLVEITRKKPTIKHGALLMHDACAVQLCKDCKHDDSRLKPCSVCVSFVFGIQLSIVGPMASVLAKQAHCSEADLAPGVGGPLREDNYNSSDPLPAM